MASGKVADWLLARAYLDHIKYLENAIKANERALSYHRTGIGLRGQRVGQHVSGTRAIDGFEISMIQSMEIADRIKSDLPRFRADLKEESRYLEMLSKEDQVLLREHFIERRSLNEGTVRCHASTEETADEIEGIRESYRALERLYEVLPATWRAPKAI